MNVFRTVSELLFRESLVRDSLGTAILRVVNVGAAFGLAVVLARGLGPAGYGAYSFAFAITSLIALPAQMGVPTLIVRELARYRALSEWGLLKGAIQRLTQVVLVASVVMIFVALFSIAIWRISSGNRAEDVLIPALLLAPFIALGNVFDASLRGLGHVLVGQIPTPVIRPMLAAIILASVFGFSDEFSLPTTAMWVHVCAAILACIISVAFLSRVLPRQVKEATTRTETRVWLRSVLPLSIITGANVIHDQADVLLLGIFRESTEVGLYRGAIQISLLVSFGLYVANKALAPRYASMWARGDLEALQRLCTRSTRYIFLIAAILILLLGAFGSDVLGIAFGDAFASAYPAMIILAAGQLFAALAGSAALILNMVGQETATMKSFGLSVILNVVFNLMLIPDYGAIGAAISTAASILVGRIFLLYWLRTTVGIRGSLFG
ncbi:flippase [Lentisalinibacter sediminis]|uniref:flippase n=1 Tax=Lentisalinibacter sediminis TaxID=2992237 RepID=UPI003863E103